jgi:hypothetical protein
MVVFDTISVRYPGCNCEDEMVDDKDLKYVYLPASDLILRSCCRYLTVMAFFTTISPG